MERTNQAVSARCGVRAKALARWPVLGLLAFAGGFAYGQECSLVVSTASLEVLESGEERYTLQCESPPAEDVTVTLCVAAASRVELSSTAAMTDEQGRLVLSFTPETGDQPQEVVVRGINDNFVQQTQRLSVSHGLDGSCDAPEAPVAVAVVNDDAVALQLRPPYVRMEEGESRFYRVSLASVPVGEVTVRAVPDDASIVAVSPQTLSFNFANWFQEQIITVDTFADDDYDDELVRIRHEVTGGSYDGIAARPTVVRVLDPDEPPPPEPPPPEPPPPPGITVSAADVTVAEAGGTASYTVVLESEPSAAVTIAPASSDPTVATVSGALEFTADNWSTAQSVVVTGVDDVVDNAADRTATISHAVAGGGYDGVPAADVAVTATNDDTAAVTVSTSGLTVSELGGMASYTVVLATEPTANVVIAVQSGDSSRISVTPGAATFTPDNWSTAQSVTVVGIEDDDFDSNTVTISHSASGGGYDAVEVDSVAVTVSDTTEQTSRERLAAVNASILPEVARAMSASTVEALSNRFAAGATAAAGPGSGAGAFAPLALAADRRTARAVGDRWQSGMAPAGAFAGAGGFGARAETGAANPLDAFSPWRQLAGNVVVMPLAAASASGAGALDNATLWAFGDYRAIDLDGAGVDWDGSMTGLHVGADTQVGNAYLGAALARFTTDIDYTHRRALDGRIIRGNHETEMTSVNPYLGWLSPKGAHLWATAGFGSGDVTITDPVAGQLSSDADLTMFAVGGGTRLYAEGNALRTTTVVLKGEASTTSLEVDAAGSLVQAMEADVQRLRLAVEAARIFAINACETITPSIELGVRNDGGDGETGSGADLNVGLGYVDTSRGLTAQGRVRRLLTHGGEATDWGFGGSIMYQPGVAGQGVTVTLRRTLGLDQDPAERMWRYGVAGDGDVYENAMRPRLETRVGYGLAAFSGQGLLTPYTELASAPGERAYRLGAAFGLRSGMEMSVEGERRQRDLLGTNDGVMLRLRMYW